MEYRQWIDEVFNWEPNIPEQSVGIQGQMSPDETLLLISQTFEHAGKDLATFSDIQIANGIDFMINEVNEPLYAVYDARVPLALRRRTIASFVPLYRDLFAVRCDNCQVDNASNPLNTLCYMLWDAGALTLDGLKQRNDPEANVLCESFMDVLETILFLPHTACQESALHGLGHSIISCNDDRERFPKSYRSKMIDMINRYLRQKGIGSRLLKYAKQAKTGVIL